ncbi:hypothetical protein EMM73_17545 [Rheinheimera sediminis]|uniref:hypothetical protein n=1 Tax=Rheinheimera sp. YQF-1 TaxID=2499626 RepID=UPI000FDC3970|nr:hypothetical protein [Rheinheimera sp. YQF-1]RVT44074.1 hypothetical protein EMM73_17545 [Rheinheimera sp. YQF-1]
MMLSSRGFILVTTLILILILSSISLPMLVQASLSQKLSASATLSAQLKLRTQSKHAQQLELLQQGTIESADFVLAPCPAFYAAWSDLSFQCEWHQLRTSEASFQHQHSVTSFLVRKSLLEGGRNGSL